MVVLAVAACAMVLASGPGSRLGLWTWQSGFAVMRYGTYAGLAAAFGALLLLLALAFPRLRASPGPPLVALVLAFVAAGPPLAMLSRAKEVPRIHDITTDLADPPAFVALASARKASPNGLAHGGEAVAVAQRQGYPDIRPLITRRPPAEAFKHAIEAAQRLGWEIAASDPGAGRIEATDTTAFFGFKDDVVVRIRADGAGSRIDVRSVSRVGLSDLGANARRIREFLARLA